METKITIMIEEWLPWAIETLSYKGEYDLLRKLAIQYQLYMQQEEQVKAQDIIKVMNLLYSSGKLHVKNAVENEFLEIIASDETPLTMKKHMDSFSHELKSAFIKTILEN
ncbi:MAG: hypothetical protein IPH57_13950 [Saprospiraceae bacterium]|nr:hypothetical protein [Saprospiraceae bacterium]